LSIVEAGFAQLDPTPRMKKIFKGDTAARQHHASDEEEHVLTDALVLRS
jgi:hypothetical protein